MTLIACTLNHKIPFLISDILITNKEKGRAHIPTLQDSVIEDLASKRNHHLAQKAYVIRPNVCLVMAGNVEEMTGFLRELKIRCSYFETVTGKHIADFIQDYEVGKHMVESSFLIFVLGELVLPNVTMAHFMHGKWDKTANELFEGAFACGTGKDQFFEYMDDIKGAGDENFITHKHREVASKNIILAAKMLASERATHKTILNQWGGGFEMIYLYGGEFVKLDNISYLLNKARVINGGFEFYPEKLLHYEYHNDILFVYSFEINNYTKDIGEDIVRITSSDFDFKLYVASPIDQKEPLTNGNLPAMSFGTDLLGVGNVYEVDKFIYTPSYFVGEGQTFVRYGHDEKKIEITIPRKMHDFPEYNMKRKIMEIITPYIKAHNKKL